MAESNNRTIRVRIQGITIANDPTLMGPMPGMPGQPTPEPQKMTFNVTLVPVAGTASGMPLTLVVESLTGFVTGKDYELTLAPVP